MNAFLPRDRVTIPELEVNGTVVSVIITSEGIEYRVRYYKDQEQREAFFFDFEITNPTVKV